LPPFELAFTIIDYIIGGLNLVAEGEVANLYNPMASLTIRIADETMKRLSTSTDREIRFNVDWLTEVVRRMSESTMDSSMNSVKMPSMRLEKVRLVARSWT
jgi:hypothetical protein